MFYLGFQRDAKILQAKLDPCAEKQMAQSQSQVGGRTDAIEETQVEIGLERVGYGDAMKSAVGCASRIQFPGAQCKSRRELHSQIGIEHEDETRSYRRKKEKMIKTGVRLRER